MRGAVPEARVMYIEPDVVGTAPPTGAAALSPGHDDRPSVGAPARGARRADPQAAPAGRAHAARPGRAHQRVQPVPVSQIERGLHEPSVRVLKAIAGALNLSAEPLLVQAGVLDGAESHRRARHRRGGRQRRPPAHRRPAGRADERLPELRRRRPEAAAQAAAEHARAAPRGERRRSIARSPARGQGWPEVRVLRQPSQRP